RQLVLAETADSGWRATLNGQALVRVAGDAPVQAFELPATGGTLKIWYEVNRWVPAGQIAIVLLTLVLALPFRRSPGPEEVEE
ncbi:MAG: hypothetical protein LBR19_10025, partial [Bifidobacteriaceae bacterium]|nr:hypothetical protein [Bifidobacteriaceae bacterium]